LETLAPDAIHEILTGKYVHPLFVRHRPAKDHDKYEALVLEDVRQ